MPKQIAVLGLGRFGENLCRELSDQGAEVLAVDIDAKAVNHISAIAEHAVIADITDERVIQELNLSSYQSVVVSLGSDVGASILATISLKEAGVQDLWVKSSNALQTKTLRKVGADQVINPERMVAKRVSKRIISKHIHDFVNLDHELAIYELKISEGLIGKTLSSLKIPNDILSLALLRSGEITQGIDQDAQLYLNDIILLAGPSDKLSKLIDKLWTVYL